jgi:predicted metalloendopeptidase
MKKRIALSLLAAAFFCLGAGEDRKTSGINVSFISTEVKPCDDFFTYANGNWMKSAKIPDEYPIWGTSWELRDRTWQVLREILEESAKRRDWPARSVRQKVGDFFASGMDEAAIERAGHKPLSSRFAGIAAISTPGELAAALGRLHLDGINAGFIPYVYFDDKDPSANIAQFWQGGLGLPDRDYYIRTDQESRGLLAKYKAHVAKMFELLGDDPQAAAGEAMTVLTFERHLAEASMTLVEQGDPSATYHKFARAGLAAATPGFDWEAYFTAIGMPAAAAQFLVRQPGFLREVAAMAQSVPLADWKIYLRWRLIDDSASKLDAKFENEHFAWNGKVLQGLKEPGPRWKRVEEVVQQGAGFALGQLFVERASSARAKQKALEIFENLRAALRERIQALEWMTPGTKEKALEKLAAFGAKIGYPDKWPDDSGLIIDRGAYVLNWMRSYAFELGRNLDKLGKPIDRSEWLLTPQIVGAEYSGTLNEICFPAAVLQSPFDPDGDEAVNYGSLGAVMGHEMSHGFDDQGRKYDASGRLQDWWTREDARAFAVRIAPLVKQYDAYKPFPDLAVNGQLTLSENIADLGGLIIAYAAFQKAMAGKPRSVGSDGFTPEQRFFISYAQHWRRIMRPEYLRLLVRTDTHAPAQYRVNGPLSNMAEFARAFDCPVGCAMTRAKEERPAVW